MEAKFNLSNGEFSVLVVTPTASMMTWLQTIASERGVPIHQVYNSADDGVYLIPEIGTFDAGQCAEFIRQIKPAIFLTELARFGRDAVDLLPEPLSEHLMDQFINLCVRETATPVGLDPQWRKCKWP